MGSIYDEVYDFNTKTNHYQIDVVTSIAYYDGSLG